MSRQSRARRHGLFRIFYSSSSKVSTSVDELPDRDKDVQRVVGNTRTHRIRHRPLVCTYVHGLSFGLADGDNHTCFGALPAEQVVAVGRLQRAEYVARLRTSRLRHDFRTTEYLLPNSQLRSTSCRYGNVRHTDANGNSNRHSNAGCL